ncbi:hypothetical protein DPMN_045634 [Dreissena polymorpha]|uniref:Uncharacterized protein n=1 Tax=Dreissena polymorpha TaxID=45954 RepID=A0A9D4D5E0_DREPO|nr:hypothetical protein DPMN_045634 [Dreissena polymorpha]
MARQRPTCIPTPHVLPRGAQGLVMGPCIVEIDRIVIREVQYQLEVKWCRHEEIIRGLCGRGAPGLVIGPCIVEINCIVIREVQYQFEVNRCRNEEIIVKGNFGWAGRPRIDRIAIRKVQYQFKVNRCRNEEIIVKLQFWVGVAYVGGAPQVEIDRIVIREVRYLFEDNRCRNEEIIFQGSSAYSVGEDSGQDGQTDRRTAEITTISPRFSKSSGIKT